MKQAGARRGLAAWSAMILGASAASAQVFTPLLESDIPFDTSRGLNVGVLERPRPDYDPVGINTGGFTILPKARIGVGYTTNVYGSTIDKTSDVFFIIEPSVKIASNWSRHFLSFSFGGQLNRFAKQSAYNETGLYAQAVGRLDIHGDDNIVAQGGVRRAYEEQYSGSFPTNSVEPVRYLDTSGLLRGTHVMGRFRMIASGGVDSLNYTNARSINGAVIDQNYRDRDIYRASGRIEYGVTPDTAVFVQAGYARDKYKHPIAPFGDNRDGHELRFLGGLTFDLSALVRASAGVGYLRRVYDSPRFANLSGLAYDVQLQYFPSGLTTVSLSSSRSTEDAIITGSSGYYSSVYRFRVDHELLRNVLPYVTADYQRNRFQGIDRIDNLVEASGGTQYLANRSLVFDAKIAYIDRKSKGLASGQVFNEWRGAVAATLQY